MKRLWKGRAREIARIAIIECFNFSIAVIRLSFMAKSSFEPDLGVEGDVFASG